jgi:hypothetical protein
MRKIEGRIIEQTPAKLALWFDGRGVKNWRRSFRFR